MPALNSITWKCYFQKVPLCFLLIAAAIDNWGAIAAPLVVYVVHRREEVCYSYSYS